MGLGPQPGPLCVLDRFTWMFNRQLSFSMSQTELPFQTYFTSLLMATPFFQFLRLNPLEKSLNPLCHILCAIHQQPLLSLPSQYIQIPTSS